jgi:hypothetical protein
MPSEKPAHANLAQLYGTRCGTLTLAPTEVTFTIRPLEILDRHSFDRADFDRARIVYQDIDASEPIQRGGDEMTDLRRIADVACDRKDLLVREALEIFPNPLQFAFTPRAKHEPRTFLGELAGESKPQTMGAPGDQHNFAREIHP